MARRLLTPRWLALTCLALLLVVAFVWLGFWQLSRAQAFRQPSSVSDPGPVAVSTLSPPAGDLPGESVGRRVVAQGSYDAAQGFVVPHRQQDGRDGYWVVGVLRLPDGSGLCVLRGWTAAATPTPAAPPSGTVTVQGRLAGSEPADGGLAVGTSLPAGQLPAVNPVNLLDRVSYPVHDGYLVAMGQQPADPAALTPVPAQPPGADVPGFFLQHLGYVGLWWLFALFVVAFWIRLLRDDLRGERVSVTGSGPG